MCMYILQHEEGKVISRPRFSFKERLEGWRIECRQRLSNVYDTVILITHIFNLMEFIKILRK